MERRLSGRAGVDQVVSAAGKELLSCDEFGLVLREEASHRVGGITAPKDLILQALRRGVVVKRGGGGVAVLCMPVWDGAVIHGVLCALRRANEGDGAKEFTEGEEAIAGVLGNILGVGVKQIGLTEMWKTKGGGALGVGVGVGVGGKKMPKKKLLKGKNKRTKTEVDDADDDLR